MQRVTSVTLTPVAAVANGIALSQTPGGAGNLTLNGSQVSGGVASFDVARRVIITSAANDSARTFTMTGTDRYGKALVEAIKGGNAAAVPTVNDFLTVSQIAVDAATAGAVTAGTSGVLSSAWFPVDRYGSMELGIGVHQDGVANWTIEHAMQDPFTGGVGVQPAGGAVTPVLVPYPHPTLAAQSANASGSYAGPISAVRLTLNSFTAGASVTADFTPGFAGEF